MGKKPKNSIHHLRIVLVSPKLQFSASSKNKMAWWGGPTVTPEKSCTRPLMSQGLTRQMNTSNCFNAQLTRLVSDASKASSNVATSTQPPSNPERPKSRLPGGPMGVPTVLDKKFLVWSGKFKTASDIPKQLEGDVIHRARSWGRIRMNIGFLLLTAAGGGLMVYLGKQAAARGESLENENLEWHRKIKEDYERSKKQA